MITNSGITVVITVTDSEGVTLPSLGYESASVSCSEESYIGDSTERSDSGVSPMNPTKVILEPTFHRLEVSMGTSGYGSGSDPSVLPMKMWIDPIGTRYHDLMESASRPQ